MDDQRALQWGDYWAETPMKVLKGPVYTWPKGWRIAYVCTWPVSVVVRWLTMLIVILAWLVTGFIGFCVYNLQCVWRRQAEHLGKVKAGA